MDALKAILSRRSVRSYTDQQVSDDVIAKMHDIEGVLAVRAVG